jgi:hypothetical protein
MPLLEFEHATPVFERAKPVHALDRAATVIDKDCNWISPKQEKVQ